MYLLSGPQFSGCRLCWYVVVGLQSVLLFGGKTVYKQYKCCCGYFNWYWLLLCSFHSLLMPNRYFGRTQWGTAIWSNREALLVVQMSWSRNTGHSIVFASLHCRCHYFIFFIVNRQSKLIFSCILITAPSSLARLVYILRSTFKSFLPDVVLVQNFFVSNCCCRLFFDSYMYSSLYM